MTPKDAVAAIVAQLNAATSPFAGGHLALDGGPGDTPTVPYVCIWDQTGRAVRGKYTGSVNQIRFPFQASCVARTPDGLRDLVGLVRGTLLDWAPVARATPIVEDGSNPIITEGEGSDRRLIAPLTLHCYLPV